MVEFSVPNNPGWAKRFVEKHGAFDGECQAISPAAIDTVERLSLRAQLSQFNNTIVKQPTSDDIAAVPQADDNEVELAVM